jgi:hypothetical protein
MMTQLMSNGDSFRKCKCKNEVILLGDAGKAEEILCVKLKKKKLISRPLINWRRFFSIGQELTFKF